SQSLVELAKKEKERREKLKGKKTIVVTNYDLKKVKKKPAVSTRQPVLYRAPSKKESTSSEKSSSDQAQSSVKKDIDKIGHTDMPAPGDEPDFNRVNIDNVPIPPFFKEVSRKFDITKHPAFTGSQKKIFVDPFYSERKSNELPRYNYRQFASTKGPKEILKWYKKAWSWSEDSSDFAETSGYWMGPFDDGSMKIGVNNAYNFIVISILPLSEGNERTVYVFHYHK
ncbi:unnamed protein product, partial [marine sediment metagenome]